MFSQVIYADHRFCMMLVAGFHEGCEWKNYEPAYSLMVWQQAGQADQHTHYSNFSLEELIWLPPLSWEVGWAYGRQPCLQHPPARGEQLPPAMDWPSPEQREGCWTGRGSYPSSPGISDKMIHTRVLIFKFLSNFANTPDVFFLPDLWKTGLRLSSQKAAVKSVK